MIEARTRASSTGGWLRTANLRDSVVNLRGLVSNLRSLMANLRMGVVKTCLRRSGWCRRFPWYSGLFGMWPMYSGALWRASFSTPVRRFGLGLRRLGPRLRRLGSRLRRSRWCRGVADANPRSPLIITMNRIYGGEIYCSLCSLLKFQRFWASGGCMGVSVLWNRRFRRRLSWAHFGHYFSRITRDMP